MTDKTKQMFDRVTRTYSSEQKTEFDEVSELAHEVFVAQVLGLKLSNRRKSLGISQRKLAELSGIQQREICRIEQGKANPTFSTLNRIHTALGLQIDWANPVSVG